ncbi:TPA: hypothetical protein DD712_01675 [Candidatus Acetothermia bacterium]|nr:hypothetical protein [Candidatus Acetothermia bacterium]
MHLHAILTVIIFLTTIVAIVAERFHRAAVVLLGAGLLILLGVITQHEAIAAIDFNSLGLLSGMMIFAAVIKRTGLFQYLAIKAAKTARGEPWIVMLFSCVVTAILSSVLENVATLLLVIPITFIMAETLRINPLPFLLIQTFAANIGGVSTLIGDPPNMIISSAAHLTFIDFLIHLTPVVLIIGATFLVTFGIFYRRRLVSLPEHKEQIMRFDERKNITDPRLLRHAVIILLLTIVGFIVHRQLHLEPATIALSGAVLLLLFTGIDLDEIFMEGDWSILFFLIGTFIVVDGLRHVGLIDMMAHGIVALTDGNPLLTTLLILWGAGLFCIFINNIPFTIAMVPLIQLIGEMTGIPMNPLWWALALGAGLGGNGSPVGSAANLVMISIAKKYGYPLRFGEFARFGIPVVIGSLLIASAYLYLRYFM